MKATLKSGRPIRALLALLGLWWVSPVHSATSLVMANGSDWAITVTSFTMPTTAGADLVPTTLTSATNQANLDVKAKNGDPTWKVTVQRDSATWYSGIHLWVQRTNTHTDTAGGTSYIEVLSTSATDFFWSTAVSTSALNVALQFQLTGLSVAMGTSNSTVITYTVLVY